jgi:uncharacterized caspase-like protein
MPADASGIVLLDGMAPVPQDDAQAVGIGSNGMKRHSIHIGIDQYEDKAIRNLPFCKADASLLASFFRDVAGYESVSTLSDPTRNSILDSVADEAARLGPGDMLVLTYSGHGFRLNDRFFLGAADTRRPFMQEGVDGIPLEMLERIVREAGCDCAFFIDACPEEGRGTRGIEFDRQSANGTGRDLSFSPSSSNGPFFAVMSPEVSLETTSLGHGVFTAVLDRALREAYEAGKPTLDFAFHSRVQEHATSICQENGILCPSIVISCSGCPAKLW